jgi:hypothetical protein
MVILRQSGDASLVYAGLAADQKRREKFLKELDPERSELFLPCALWIAVTPINDRFRRT